MYTCPWTHIVCKLRPPPSANKCVTCARSVRVCAWCVCVCAHCARACELYARARARAVRAHCTRALYAKSVRQNLLCFVNICCLFIENRLRFFKTCCAFFIRTVHTCGGRTVRRARARVRCVRGRARANRALGERARCTYAPCARTARTVREPYARTVRKKCALKSAVFYSKSAVSFFKICCVFFQNLLCFLYVRSARTVAVRHGARARAVYVRATRAPARRNRTRAHRARARCTYRTRAPYSRTVRKKRVPNPAFF